MKKEALRYLSRGLSVIPVGTDKIPLIPWKKYQKTLPTVEEIETWWEEHPSANIGIVTGKVSNLVVVDVEKGGSVAGLPPTFTVKTGGGGWHLYYKYHPIDNKTRIRPLTDIRGDGGYVVAPPSIHSSGESYEVLLQDPMVDFPAHLFQTGESNWKNKITAPINEGSRNNDFASIIGGLLQRFPQDDWDTVVWKTVENSNRAQKTPLELTELKSVFLSIAKAELARRQTGGDIKAVEVESSDEEIRITITLAREAVCFKVKNITNNLLEANVITWIKKVHGLTHEIPFYLKIKSDSNKEQWARVLSKAFDRKEEKEVYPWTILVSKATAEVEKKVREHKQDFLLSEIVSKPLTWLYEPFIQEGQINTYFGLGSSGKTMLSMYFATQVAAQGVKTLLIDYENDGGSFKDKMNQMLPPDDRDTSNFVYFESEQIPMYEQIDKIKETIKRRGIGLVIVDSASLSSGDSTSDEAATLRLISAIKLLKTTTILIAHQRKNEGDKNPIGSIQFENQARNVWNFKSMPDDFDNNVLHVACKHTKANNTYLRKDPYGFKITFGAVSIVVEKEDAISNFEDKFSVIERIKNLLEGEGSLGYKEIAEKLGITNSTANKNLSAGKAKGLFKNEDGTWSLPDHKEIF